jgi:glucosyl-dolichyl phosphate glucuronosyltransferase
MPYSISIIVSTHNRAPALRQMLRALSKVRIPFGWKSELILVDNGSTDDTAAVVRGAALMPNMQLSCLYEPRKGKSNALNLGLGKARGDFLLFTDDDVSVAEDWVEQIVTPLADEQADAVVGQITLAPNLMKPWLSAMHERFLAANNSCRHDEPMLIGANMAFRRTVLERVPAFDSELGPGALGLAEETLFGLQLTEAGFKVALVENAKVIHHVNESRLLRRHWLDIARKYGRTRGYFAYHWYHRDLESPHLKAAWFSTKLSLRRLIQPPQKLDQEGCPEWELCYSHELEMYRQFCVERKRPRNYTRRGLKKVSCLP